MGREFELKYAAAAADLEKLKARYPQLRPIAMETTYYDNEAGDFSRLKWTFRRRMENEKSICTLKTPPGWQGFWNCRIAPQSWPWTRVCCWAAAGNCPLRKWKWS